MLNRFKVLLTFLLVIILTCSFALIVNAEESADISSPEVSDTSADNDSADDMSSENEEKAEGEEESEEDEQTAATIKNPWTGWIIAGIVLIVIALFIFVSIKKNTRLGQKIVKFYKDYRSEIKKIVWLSRKELIKKTGVVLVTIIIAAIFLGLLDYAFTNLILLIGKN